MLTSDQLEIRDLARDFAEGEIRPHSAAWDRDGAFDRGVLAKLSELGFMGMLVPEEYGGLGLDVPTYLVALEQIAWGDAALALTVAIQNGPIPQILLTHGSDAQKEEWLPAVASGQKIVGFALSESDAGSDPSGMATVAAREGDEWTLTGSKRWVTNGGLADAMYVFARTGGSEDRPDIGAFLVDTGDDGYRVAGRETTLGLRASETVAVELTGVRVGCDRLVGDPAKGLGYALGALSLGRLGIGAQALGIAQAAMEHATGYAMERKQFGRAIAGFGAIRSKLAVMATRIAASRALLYDVAGAYAAGGGGGSDPFRPTLAAQCAMAKLDASETAAWVSDEAVQIFGGYGYMREYPVEKLMRDAKGTEIYEGTSEILRLVIGRSMTRDEG